MLISNSFVVPISRLPAAVQEEIIHWVFNNEDRCGLSLSLSALLPLSFPSLGVSALRNRLRQVEGKLDLSGLNSVSTRPYSIRVDASSVDLNSLGRVLSRIYIWGGGGR